LFSYWLLRDWAVSRKGLWPLISAVS
jgi:hypothetical protein